MRQASSARAPAVFNTFSMTSPADYYNGLPPITRAFATVCFATTVGTQLGLVRGFGIAILL